jgi:flagellar hook-associated protein 1 FlgK
VLDATFRTESGSAEGAAATRDLQAQIEGILGEPSETGLAASLDAFWSSWSDLATNPNAASARGAVRERGAQLAGTLNRMAVQLGDLASTTRTALGSTVNEANELGRRVADLNTRIVAAEADGTSANDLRDERDRAIDSLSKLGAIETVERHDGSVAVYVSGSLFVDQAATKPLALGTVGGQITLVFAQVPDRPISAPGSRR